MSVVHRLVCGSNDGCCIVKVSPLESSSKAMRFHRDHGRSACHSVCDEVVFELDDILETMMRTLFLMEIRLIREGVVVAVSRWDVGRQK